MKTPKKIILCADDYGQTDAISQAIVELIKAKRISAVSCMVTNPCWINFAQKILPFQDEIDIGLHFNLTEGKSISGAVQFQGIEKVLVKSHLWMLCKKNIQQELSAQLDAFSTCMQRYPDFIDGHQHIQSFPIVRDALFAEYMARKMIDYNCYIRCVASADKLQLVGIPVKQIILDLSGALSFKRALSRLKIPNNSSFSGVYPFKDSANYSKYFPQFLTKIRHGGLILCHPGFADNVNKDALDGVRENEFRYLQSNKFLEDLQKTNVMLSTFSNL